MAWTSEIVMLSPRDSLIDVLIELLKRMGFMEYEKVPRRGEWGLDIIALRKDPIAGTEKVIIALHEKGLADSRRVNQFGELLDEHRADKGVFVSPAGFTKDAKLLLSREYRGRIVPWDGDKLASLLNNYSVPVPEDIERILEEREEVNHQEETLREFNLDAPLLYEFSPEEILKGVARYLSSNYPIEPDEVELSGLRVKLQSAYIISWAVDDENKGRAVVFSRDKIVLRADEDAELSNPIRKARLDSPAVIRATERELEVPLTPGEAVLVLKETAAKELGTSENKVQISDRRKVYVPKEAELEFKIGANRGTALVKLPKGKVEASIEPLPEKYFVEKAREAVMKATGEGIKGKGVKITKKKKKVLVSGTTERFSFEAAFNPYTGKLLRLDTRMSEEAVKKLLAESYPGSEILGVEFNKKSAVADLLTGDTVVSVAIDLSNGETREVARFPSLKGAVEKGKSIIEENFPVNGLSLSSYRVVEHKYLELELSGEDGMARVRIDGSTGDVLDYYVEISEKRAGELVLEKYPGYEIASVSDEGDEYLVDAANETHEIKVRLSKDGKMMEEIDRILRRKLAEKIAEEKAREVDPEAKVDSIELAKDWVVTFTGVSKVGKLVLHRATGEIVEKEAYFTERALEEFYHRHVREKYGEENPRTERLTHYKDKGYVHIKVSGKDRLYYARIDTRSGGILKEDSVSAKGLTARLKQMNLEREYR
ncbi:restriction endonuclease [Thermococcus profundus]|uniref:Restriction endonuclease n=1 Tax=Thermococcus profundus TaxID=49899 RepID=A0A2Z2M9Q5_THEPR|nr:restriction endonuclease [Thermococcus profundus]ASJ03077.1 restriction endonuclease [Thermococcus profundus]